MVNHLAALTEHTIDPTLSKKSLPKMTWWGRSTTTKGWKKKCWCPITIPTLAWYIARLLSPHPSIIHLFLHKGNASTDGCGNTAGTTIDLVCPWLTKALHSWPPTHTWTVGSWHTSVGGSRCSEESSNPAATTSSQWLIKFESLSLSWPKLPPLDNP